MSVKSTSSVGDASGVVRTGYLKKLRTSKRRKFFVLRTETAESAARLEYYDSEKKYLAGVQPKRAITLKSCFNINKQADSKHKHVIALYTKDDRFCVLFENDEELESWLKILLLLQHGDEICDGVTPRPTFEHVWQVNVLKRGLGTNYCGKEAKSAYRLCLTDKILSLVKKDTLDMKIELDLSSIRSCGNLKTYFFMEVGRNSEIGAGELWMETEDQNIAQNIHHTVYHAMISKKDDDELEPKLRNRSSSATESTKSANSRRPMMSGKLPFQSDLPQNTSPEASAPTTSGYTSGHSTNSGRERCDSMPSRPRTTSEGGTHNMCMNIIVQNRVCLQRPQSYCHQFSPSGSPITPPSAAGSTDSTGSSNSVDECDNWVHDDLHRSAYSHSLTPDEPIVEEDNCDDFFCERLKPRLNSEGGYVDMSPGNKHITSPTTSLSSITSGTPSTDYKFNEYNIDKPIHILRTEDEELRPERTKSVGSTDSKMKLARERAFSCGAKTKKLPDRFFHPHPYNPKSNSAPLLQSHGDPKSDLMLLDFSANSYLPKKHPSSSGYVPMKPGVIPDLNHNHDNTKRRSQQTSTDSLLTRGNNRIIMKGHEIRSSNQQDYVDMRAGTSPKVASTTPTGYMVMDLTKNKRENNTKKYNSSPLSRSPISPPTAPSDYMDMNYNKNHPQNNKIESSISPNIFEGSSPNSIEFIDSDAKETNDGYVEMTPGKGISATHQRQSSIESNNETDYANMSFVKTDAKKSSQPIQIQTKTPQISTYHFWSKKETPPNKMQLNLSINSNYSSLPRRNRNDSKDSSSSSVTTPSSSSTIFPLSLNSPVSPLNPTVTTTNQDSDYTVMDYNPHHQNAAAAPNKTSSPILNASAPREESAYTLMTPGGGFANPEKCFRPIDDDSPKDDRSSRPSSTSTLVASRPSSVNSEQLLYASLELKSNEEEESSRSPRTVKENPQEPVQSGFQYAKIDFVKSNEGFGTVNHPAAMVNNTKVKH